MPTTAPISANSDYMLLIYIGFGSGFVVLFFLIMATVVVIRRRSATKHDKWKHNFPTAQTYPPYDQPGTFSQNIISSIEGNQRNISMMQNPIYLTMMTNHTYTDYTPTATLGNPNFSPQQNQGTGMGSTIMSAYSGQSSMPSNTIMSAYSGQGLSANNSQMGGITDTEDYQRAQAHYNQLQYTSQSPLHKKK